jgi:hypothetical protein
MMVTVIKCAEEQDLPKVLEISTSITMKVPLRLMMDMCIASVVGQGSLFPYLTAIITMKLQDKLHLTMDTYIIIEVAPVKLFYEVNISDYSGLILTGFFLVISIAACLDLT